MFSFFCALAVVSPFCSEGKSLWNKQFGYAVKGKTLPHGAKPTSSPLLGREAFPRSQVYFGPCRRRSTNDTGTGTVAVGQMVHGVGLRTLSSTAPLFLLLVATLQALSLPMRIENPKKFAGHLHSVPRKKQGAKGSFCEKSARQKLRV